MSRKHNLALAEREETLSSGKENLPRIRTFSTRHAHSRRSTKGILTAGKDRQCFKREIRDMARNCVLSHATRQKELAAYCNVSEGQISQWLNSDKMPICRAFQMIEFWLSKRREANTSFDARLERVFNKMVEMFYGTVDVRGIR